MAYVETNNRAYVSAVMAVERTCAQIVRRSIHATVARRSLVRAVKRSLTAALLIVTEKFAVAAS